MAFWVTHLIVADRILELIPWLDRRGFSVGNIAPDCNIPNSDWSAFTPSREATHFMSGKVKKLSAGDTFAKKYLTDCENVSNEQYSFFLGYYTHLTADALFYNMIHDDQRLENALRRAIAKYGVSGEIEGCDKWTAVKKLVPKDMRTKEINSMEAEYLKKHPNSAYITEILALDSFPDYIDFLPHGSITDKIRMMGYMPSMDEGCEEPVAISRGEYKKFLDDTVALVINKFNEKGWIVNDDYKRCGMGAAERI